MKRPIVEIEELGEPNSIIYRKDAPISEIINTQRMLVELNEQLRLHFVVGQSEQFICRDCGKNTIEWADGLCEDCTLKGFK